MSGVWNNILYVSVCVNYAEFTTINPVAFRSTVEVRRKVGASTVGPATVDPLLRYVPMIFFWHRRIFCLLSPFIMSCGVPAMFLF